MSNQQQSDYIHHFEAGDVTAHAAHKIQDKSELQKYSAQTKDLHQNITGWEWKIAQQSQSLRRFEKIAFSYFHFEI